ncbi:uncharacterized protein LY89DRAFT_274672 [Mollisia scopiformis]|uniref:Zn(2)-C6 fungal-type domain-containing protein n=1 Tax=Mollisia scopiformis TaxID=149040 RepID=A0A132BB31_MOLSC|nr:uncharacterized protein LY89DRAFT_274672 [Mollisia scopiformis]KUJ09630.1 hypothetical protein LY89DRAFT_274672 [Mollisia scopiformis]
MVKALETKACDACGKAKRKCGKQTPRCLRCRTRGIECTYPPARPTRFVLLEDDNETPVVEPEAPVENALELPVNSSILQTRGTGNIEVDLPASGEGLIDDRLATSWFASLETWKVRFPRENQCLSVIADSKRFVTAIRRWLMQWIEKGTNPFIHKRLYQTRFPRSIQDAYTALSCYLHKTTSNEGLVLQIIENRATQLVAESQMDSAKSSIDENSSGSALDTLAHVARVQALLIYQFICLYDGDIRLRHLGESHIPVLDRWMRDMLDQSSHAPCLGGTIISQTLEQTRVRPSYVSPTNELIWYSWVVAESVRRTWVVGSGIQVVFLALQRGGAPPCQGGVMYTTRHGVWEAPSAMAWEKLCSEVHVGLMQMADAERLFTDVSPEEVNEFTKVVLDVTFGRERMERWGVHVED